LLVILFYFSQKQNLLSKCFEITVDERLQRGEFRLTPWSRETCSSGILRRL